MADQAPLQEGIRPFRIPQRTFLERYSPLGVYVLLAESLDDTQRKDPEIDEIAPSLRQSCSAHELCYVKDVRYSSNGNYWATVAARPDMIGAEQIMLDEEHLKFALAWHEGMRWMQPASIRRLMRTHARNLEPLCPREKSSSAATLTTYPVLPLAAQDEIAVSVDDLQAALAPVLTPSASLYRAPSPFAVQQCLLQLMLGVLERQLVKARDHLSALYLKATCDLVERMMIWHRRTRQRLVNAARGWCEERQRLVWKLALGVPEIC